MNVHQQTLSFIQSIYYYFYEHGYAGKVVQVFPGCTLVDIHGHVEPNVKLSRNIDKPT